MTVFTFIVCVRILVKNLVNQFDTMYLLKKILLFRNQSTRNIKKYFYFTIKVISIKSKPKACLNMLVKKPQSSYGLLDFGTL